MSHISVIRNVDGSEPDFPKKLSPRTRFSIDVTLLVLVLLGLFKLGELILWMYQHISVAVSV